jgi:uncharacterized protein (DUF736 family)
MLRAMRRGLETYSTRRYWTGWRASPRPYKKVGGSNEFNGEIQTLSLQAKKVRIVPAEASSNENAPSHRVTLARIELGAAWTRTSKEDGHEYLSLKLDDPSFYSPIYANLIADDDTGESYSLIWSRPSANRNGN